MKVALAIDGSPCSLRATRFAIGLIAGRTDAVVHVVNVQPPVRYADILPEDKQQLVERWNKDGAENETCAAMEMLADAGIASELHLVTGDPAPSIVAVARQYMCDLIVLGTRGMGTVAGLVLGSVAAKVVHLAEVPLILVK